MISPGILTLPTQKPTKTLTHFHCFLGHFKLNYLFSLNKQQTGCFLFFFFWTRPCLSLVLLCMPFPWHASSTKVTAVIQMKYFWHNKKIIQQGKKLNWLSWGYEGRKNLLLQNRDDFSFFFKECGQPPNYHENQKCSTWLWGHAMSNYPSLQNETKSSKNSESFSPIKTAVPGKAL